MQDKDFYRPDEIAKLLDVTDRTIYRWIDEGTLKAVRVGRKTVRVTSESLQSIIRPIED